MVGGAWGGVCLHWRILGIASCCQVHSARTALIEVQLNVVVVEEWYINNMCMYVATSLYPKCIYMCKRCS